MLAAERVADARNVPAAAVRAVAVVLRRSVPALAESLRRLGRLEDLEAETEETSRIALHGRRILCGEARQGKSVPPAVTDAV